MAIHTVNKNAGNKIWIKDKTPDDNTIKILKHVLKNKIRIKMKIYKKIN